MYLRLANMILSVSLALAPLAASADLAPMAADELRAVNGQGGSLIYNPPPAVKRLDRLSSTLDRYGFERAAQAVHVESRILYFVLSPCGRPGVYC